MKRTPIETKPAFQPFTLTIETEDEAKVIASLLGGCSVFTFDKDIGVKDGTSREMFGVVKDFNTRKVKVVVAYGA